MAETPDLEPERPLAERPRRQRSVDEELARAELRLAERTRELDMLQALGRRASEARSLEDLFASIVTLLHQTVELDLALVGHGCDGEPERSLFLSRPFTNDYLLEVHRRVRRFLGEDADGTASALPRELPGYDAARGVRRNFLEQDVVVLPLLRKGRPVACLLVVPSASTDERRLRLLYSASNQLSLHLERILTVREAEADRFRSIVNAMPQGVVLTDSRLRILQANEAAEAMLGVGDLAAESSFEGKLARLGLGAIVEPVRTGTWSFAEGEARPDAEHVWNLTASALPAVRGNPGGLVFVLTDVTESRRLQGQMAQNEKMSSLGQMISGVAHELNNPLASIVGYAQLVKGAGTDERTTRHLDVLSREADRCKKIVQNLLSFARHHDPQRKTLSINQTVDNVLSLLEYQLRVDDIRLDRELNRDLPSMEGDPHQLEQVLVNLITNAAQAIRKTDEPGRVHVRTAFEDDRTIVLEVGDDGPGIPSEMRSRVFDPFFTTKDPGEGTGLGLSLVYGIVTSHAGTIDIVEGEGRGTTFRLSFPVGDRDGAPVETKPDTPDPAGGRAGRILVVDDDATVAQLICEALEAEGHATRRAANGKVALRRLAEGEFDLVVSDVKMPGMSGEQLHVELQRTCPHMAKRMMLTTGDTLGASSDELGRRTGLEVLRKPFDVEELRGRVRAWLAEN